jgi:membrane associated rhomboid family serine protease
MIMQQEMSFQMPRPGKALIGVMVAVVAIWVLFAVGLNWGGASPAVLAPFIGDSSAVLHGQIWRLFTAPLIHHPSDPGHVLVTIFGLYFLGTTLEDRWGPKKMLLFLFGSAAFAFALQVLVGALVHQVESAKWFGGLGMVEAVAVAWALNNRHATVRLFFILPVSGTMLLVFIFGMSVFNVLALRAPAEGLITPFGGMLAGYLFSDASPLRRYWLKLRLRRLQAQTAALGSAASAQRRRAGPPLRVIQGGGDRPPKDKRYLN